MAGRGGALWNIQGGSAAWRAGHCQVMARRCCASCGGAAGSAIWRLGSAAFVEQRVLPAKARTGFPLSAAAPGMASGEAAACRNPRVSLCKSLLPSRLPNRSCQSLLPNRRGRRRSGGGGGRSCAKPLSAERRPAHDRSPIVRHLARWPGDAEDCQAGGPETRKPHTSAKASYPQAVNCLKKPRVVKFFP